MFLLKPFVALAVVANVLPILPIVLDTVREVPVGKRTHTLLSALAAGNIVALIFALCGGLLLGLMSVGVDDLRIAGGLVLLVFAVHDLLFSRELRKAPLQEMAAESEGVGLVPLGVPLLVGPATLATVLVVSEAYGFATTALAVVLNALLNVVILVCGARVLSYLGHGTMRATGKIMGLMVAAVAVAMIRTGVVNFIGASA